MRATLPCCVRAPPVARRARVVRPRAPPRRSPGAGRRRAGPRAGRRRDDPRPVRPAAARCGHRRAGPRIGPVGSRAGARPPVGGARRGPFPVALRTVLSVKPAQAAPPPRGLPGHPSGGGGPGRGGPVVGRPCRAGPRGARSGHVVG
ncbi:MAG: hypothetical protein M3Q48_08590, partial [Actinomycetota bacterium]|nr:hypothetical protein [Actinomycetota bacterium]